jgi:hypothetical protein
MKFLDNDDIILVGDVQALVDPAIRTGHLVMALIGMTAIAIPVILSGFAESYGFDLVEASTLGEISLGVAAGVMLLVRWITFSVTSDGAAAVTFHRTATTAQIFSPGLMGMEKELISFRDVASIRLTRGGRANEGGLMVPILRVRPHREIQMPADLSERDLMLLKVLTGLRSA